MIIDSEEEYQNFLKKYIHQELIINIIGCDDRYHPVVDDICAIFIKSIFDGKDFVLSVNHPDNSFRISKERLLVDFNQFTNTLWTMDKKRTIQFLPLEKLNDINIYDYMETGDIVDIYQYKQPAHVFYSRMFKSYSELNCVIPLVCHAAWYEQLHDSLYTRISSFRLDDAYKHINEELTTSFAAIESNGLKVNVETFNKFFSEKEAKITNGFVYTQYNIFTSTGRPSNRFGNINYAGLKKDDGCRSSFVSRYGMDGHLFMIDYSAYHPRLIAKLVRYDLPENVYEYLGKYYFEKDNLSEEEIKAAKTITFQMLYGNIPEKYSHTPFFEKIQHYINHRWAHFTKYGYVETPLYQRRITPNNINDPNPQKLFNYILQASETEYNVNILHKLIETLKNTQTKPILYTYDSILFDVHKDDGMETLKSIKHIMSVDNTIPVKCYRGDNYHEMPLISI